MAVAGFQPDSGGVPVAAAAPGARRRPRTRGAGEAGQDKQALLYQLVGYVMAVRPSAPQEGGLLA